MFSHKQSMVELLLMLEILYIISDFLCEFQGGEFMLHLWYRKDITSDDAFFIDSRYMLNQRKSWYNDIAKRVIEDVDRNRYIGDGVSESHVYGICGPDFLSGGTKALIFAMNNPELTVDLGWLGDNCAVPLEYVSAAYDVSFAYNDCCFIFTDTQKIHCMELDRIVTGFMGYHDCLRELL